LTYDIEVKDNLPKSSSRINRAVIVCMMIRMALDSDKIPEEVIDDFIRRLEE
jgi:hypothetical protein